MSNTDCDSCYYCCYSSHCYSCSSCRYCSFCYYSKDLRMSERMGFCVGEGKWESKGIGYQKNNHWFNKPMTPKRWDEIKKIVDNILEGLELELNKNSCSEEWKKVTKAQWLKISELPEFDKEVVEKRIGFELNLEDTSVTVTCKVGKKKSEVQLVKNQQKL